MDHFKKCITPVYDDIGYQNVQLFIRSKNDISAVAIFKYSLHMFKETILHRIGVARIFSAGVHFS